MEIWKPIPRYVGYYEASNLGRIRQILRVTYKDYRIVKGSITKQGYINHTICGKYEQAHILVAEAFYAPKDYGLYVLHIDYDKSNNNINNLKWSNTVRNEADPRLKLIYQYDLNNNLVKEWLGIREMCKILNISRSNLNRHLNGHLKTCKKFIFKRK